MARVCGVVAVVIAGLSPVAAQDAADKFDALFGPELRRVAATPGADDDIDLARQLLQVAEAESTAAPMADRLCVEVYELLARSTDSEALDTAAHAMRLRVKRQPEAAADSGERILAVMQRAYLTARGDDRTQCGEALINEHVRQAQHLVETSRQYDTAVTMLRRAQAVASAIRSERRHEIASQIEAIAHRQRVDARVSAALEKLKADPKDSAAAADLIRLLVVERDDPVEARKYTFLVDDETRERVAMATRDPAELDSAAALSLGEWYRDLARETPGDARAVMLTRAKTYIERFLATHTQTDLHHVKATLTLKQINDELDKLTGGRAVALTPRGGPTRWPVSRDGLVFAWRDASDRSAKLEPRGKAELLKNGRMDVSKGAIIVHGFNEKLLEACRQTNQLTIEAIVQPYGGNQTGPARIISFSTDGGERNFTLGQEKAQFDIRIRTTSTGTNGSIPNGSFGAVTGATEMHHVLVTYAPGRLMGYVNGELVMNRDDVTGDLSNWTPQQLLFGDEFKDDRNWNGALSHIAIYARAVDVKEAERRFAAVKRLLGDD